MLKVDFQTFALKLTTENTFMFTSNFYKLTVAQWVDPFCYISDIYMTKTEPEVVNPSKPKF